MGYTSATVVNRALLGHPISHSAELAQPTVKRQQRITMKKSLPSALLGAILALGLIFFPLPSSAVSSSWGSVNINFHNYSTGYAGWWYTYDNPNIVNYTPSDATVEVIVAEYWQYVQHWPVGGFPVGNCFYWDVYLPVSDTTLSTAGSPSGFKYTMNRWEETQNISTSGPTGVRIDRRFVGYLVRFQSTSPWNNWQPTYSPTGATRYITTPFEFVTLASGAQSCRQWDVHLIGGAYHTDFFVHCGWNSWPGISDPEVIFLGEGGESLVNQLQNPSGQFGGSFWPPWPNF